MPRLELKPWKLEEWQVVWESKDGLRRIVVVFDVFGRMVRMQFLDEGKWTTEPANSIEWQEAALDLLGIPETIEEVKSEIL